MKLVIGRVNTLAGNQMKNYDANKKFEGNMPEMLRLIDRSSLQDLWRRIRTSLEERYSYLTDQPMRPIEREPASEEDLLALESFWGFPLPPSYRLLLSLFNGAERFAYSTPLLGATEIINRAEDWYVVDELNPALIDYVFAADSESDLFFVFDPASRRSDGEMDVVIYTADGGEERHKNIIDFLFAYLRALEAGIARERADRKGLSE